MKLKPIILTQMTPEFRSTPPSDKERAASWYKGPYSAMKWEVFSRTPKPGEVGIPLDFNVPAKGGTLADYPAFIRVAKEFAFWRWTRGGKRTPKVAASFVQRVRAVLNFLCALTHRGFRSLDTVPSEAYRQILTDWSFDTELMLQTPERVQEALAAYNSVNDVPSSLLTNYGTNGPLYLKRYDVLEELGLPRRVGPLTRLVFDQAAVRLGLGTSAKGVTEEEAEESTNESAKSHQGLLHWIYKNRSDLRCENFAFDPSLISVTTQKSFEKTPVIPPKLAFAMLAGCAREQEDTAPILLNTPKSSRNAKWTKATARYCSIVRALTIAVTARRPIELDLMQRDCLRGDDEGGWFAHIYIVKNVQGWAWIPIPPFVARAIQSLIDLSPDLRPDEPLFAFRTNNGKLREVKHIKGMLNALAADYDAVSYLADNDETKEWDWNENQFRRFTAIMYFHGYNGSIAAISHILRHFNLGQTWGYTRYDQSLKQMWHEVEKEFLQLIAEEALAGTLTGPMGHKLVRDAQKLIAHATETMEQGIKREMEDLYVIDPRNFEGSIQHVIRRMSLVIVPKAWVICTCPATASAARRAACRVQGGTGTTREIGPDFGRAGPQVCPGCMFAVENQTTREYARIEIDKFKLSCQSPCMEGTVLGGLQQTQLATVLKIEAAA
ncbi:hypothetical protein [Shinella sp.]|uniref:hypothetical protein n=1 Tax=Shinella sp. TaxID=1870904 RepID=UPI003F6EC5E6